MTFLRPKGRLPSLVLPAALRCGVAGPRGSNTAQFNARHQLRGHLFAGRYKAVLVEREKPAYGRVVSDYIHLNPARAHIVKPQLRTYKWSSFPIFSGEGKPPKWLRAADVFSWHRFDWRRAADRRAYGKYLQRRAEESWTEQTGRKAREAGELLEELRSGCILGGEAFRDRMLSLATAVVREKKRESLKAFVKGQVNVGFLLSESSKELFLGNAILTCC